MKSKIINGKNTATEKLKLELAICKENKLCVKYSVDSNIIKIVAVDELPLVIGRDYPIEEINYVIDQVRKGKRENGCIMLFFENRLYEIEATE